jgi:hypothetical protein
LFGKSISDVECRRTMLDRQSVVNQIKLSFESKRVSSKVSADSMGVVIALNTKKRRGRGERKVIDEVENS